MAKLGIEEDQCDISTDKVPFTVKFDKSKVDGEKLLAAFKAAGEEAKIAN